MVKHILLVNDDGQGSPFLEWTIEVVKDLAAVQVLIPSEEQSWKGKSMTSTRNLVLRKLVLQGHAVQTLDGTPADCANIGIHSLCNPKPDLVISGVNVGLNSGVGFALSSGTLGACFDGNIAGLPGIGISQSLDRRIYEDFKRTGIIADSELERLRRENGAVLRDLLVRFIAAPQLLRQRVTWSINLPFHLAEGAPLRVCGLGQDFYRECFRPCAAGFEPLPYKPTDLDSNPESDSRLLQRGVITVTEIDVSLFGQMPQSRCTELQDFLER